MTPKQGSAFGCVSPREVFLGRKLDYNKDIKLSFGDYAQVHQDDVITNTMAERTVGALALGPIGKWLQVFKFSYVEADHQAQMDSAASATAYHRPCEPQIRE
jgi:hypothetical protein